MPIIDEIYAFDNHSPEDGFTKNHCWFNSVMTFLQSFDEFKDIVKDLVAEISRQDQAISQDNGDDEGDRNFDDKQKSDCEPLESGTVGIIEFKKLFSRYSSKTPD